MGWGLRLCASHALAQTLGVVTLPVSIERVNRPKSGESSYPWSLMAHSRTILVLAALHAERRKRIESIAAAAGFECAVCEELQRAVLWLDAQEPRVVLFDTAVAGAQALCLRVRQNKNLAAVPIIGLTRNISDGALSKLFAAGADDVVPMGLTEPLLARLRTVPVERSLRPPPDRGAAVVADSDGDRCSIIGRTLIDAGYDVRFAIDRRILDHYVTQPGIRLVVANAELGKPPEMVAAARKAGCAAAWIITDIERDVASGVDPISSVDRAIIISAFIPPESLLFLSNELLSPQQTSKRASQRMLHGTAVHFREAGADDDDLGFSYNVSIDGVFVRTLAPPQCQSLWIELRPPGMSRRVRLEGNVAWTRTFSPGKFAITPAGFGVHFVDGLGGDLERWRAAIQGMTASARRRHSVDEILEQTLLAAELRPASLQPRTSLPNFEEAELLVALPHAPVVITSERVSEPGAPAANQPSAPKAPPPPAAPAVAPPAPRRTARTLVVAGVGLAVIAIVAIAMLLAFSNPGPQPPGPRSSPAQSGPRSS